MRRKIQSISVYEEKKLDNPNIEYDTAGKLRPAWIKIKNPIKSKFLTLSFGYGNIPYLEFLHSGFYLPVNYTKDEMKKLYGQFAETYDSVIKNFGDEAGAIKKAIDLFGRLEKDKSSRILDIGSGTGRGAAVLSENGYHNITLLELSKEMLKKARENPVLRNCRFIETEFVRFDATEKYDVVTTFFAFGALSYFSEQEIKEGLVKINHLLANEGIFVVVGISDISLFEEAFSPVFSGEFELKEGLKTMYFIGQKK